jgi:hypothetical protein
MSSGATTAHEGLRHVMSLPAATTITRSTGDTLMHVGIVVPCENSSDLWPIYYHP